MKKRFITTLILILVFSSNLFAFQNEANKKGFNSITQRDMKTHLTFLASDELEGREMCEPGSRVAAAYIASRFEHLGLIPLGDNNTYMQNLKVRRIGVEPEAASFNLHHTDSKVENFSLITDFLINRGNLNEPLPVVFAGYGLDLEHYSDYKNIDVKGKLVLYFSHTPQEGLTDGKFSDPQYARDYNLYTMGRRSRNALKSKVEMAKEKGAAGIIIVENPNHEHTKNYETLKRMMINFFYNQRQYSRILEERASSRLPQVWISEGIAQKLFMSAGKSMNAIQKEFDKTAQPNSFEIEGIKISFTSSGEKSIKNTRNVVGMIEGSDPVLKNEVIVIGGHYDHVGIRNGVVFNGADDDASGTVGVIELAEAFVENNIKPKRSMIFIAFTGEEKGMIGSEHYAANPYVPVEKIAGMIQLDMLGRNEDIINLPRQFLGMYGENPPKESAEDNVNAVNILGTTYCNEMKLVNERNNENIKLDLKFRYDDTHFIRGSDHRPFLQKGVPSIFFFTGCHPDLHAPGDDVEKINFPKMEKIVKLVYLTAWELAGRSDRLSLDKTFK